jgi:hypothetical protein
MKNPAGSPSGPDAAVVELLLPIPSLTFVTIDRAQISQTAEWLKAAQLTQLPRNKMGAVHQWCKITLLTLQGTKQISSTSIYSTSDGETELLNQKQRQQLLDVFGLEEIQTEPYIKPRGD